MTIDWSEPAPETLGFDARRLAEAVAFHRHHESPWLRAMYLPDGRYVGTASIGDRPRARGGDRPGAGARPPERHRAAPRPSGATRAAPT